MSNILQFPETMARIAERVRAAYQRTHGARREWIEATLELAAALAEGRERFPSDNHFAHWIVDAGLEDIGHQDRAALISMAGNLPLARVILQETQRLSWQLIWREEMSLRFTSASKPERQEPNQVAACEIPPTEAETRDISQDTPPNREEPDRLPPRPVSGRHSLQGLNLDRLDEVAPYYGKHATRALKDVLDVKGNKRRMWSLVLTALDAGFLTKNDTNASNIGLLFPGAPRLFKQRYDLSNCQKLLEVERVVMPAALANREAVLANPDKIDEIIRGHADIVREQALAAQRAKKIDAAKAAMKAGESEVMVFGQRFWPIVDLPHAELAYSYEELRRAAWTFRELHTVTRLGSDGSPKSCGVSIRHVIKFLNGYMNQRVMQLLVDMSRALERNPDGEERLPDMPMLDRPYD